MTSTETTEDPTPKELWRALRSHPRDFPERLIVLAVTHQGPAAKAWARERAQTRMVLRIAALYGRDPTDPHIAAELLALRGVYPSVPEADAALERIGREPRPTSRRARIRSWVGMVKRVLVLAAFTSASNPDEEPGRSRQALTFVIGGAIWVVTWIVPLTFMILMAWSCDTSTRQLGAIALEFYSGEGVHDPRGLKAIRTAPEHGSDRVRYVLTPSAIAPV